MKKIAYVTWGAASQITTFQDFAGYLDEMNAAEAAIAAGRTDELPTYLTDRWLADCTLYGPAARVREGVEQWREAGITTPVLVPLSPDGNQINGLNAVFAAFER